MIIPYTGHNLENSKNVDIKFESVLYGIGLNDSMKKKCIRSKIITKVTSQDWKKNNKLEVEENLNLEQ